MSHGSVSEPENNWRDTARSVLTSNFAQATITGAGLIYGWFLLAGLIAGGINLSISDSVQDDMDNILDQTLYENVDLTDLDQCYYLQPDMATEIKFTEAHQGPFLTPILMAASGLLYSGYETHALGTVPQISSVHCDLFNDDRTLDNTEVVKTVQSLKSDFYNTNKETLADITHKGNLETTSVSRTGGTPSP